MKWNEGHSKQPIFELPPVKYLAEDVLRILLDPKISEERITTERPARVDCSATFVVDISKLAHPDDIKHDAYGKWSYSGSHPVLFHVKMGKGGCVRIERCKPGTSGKDVVFL